MTDIIRIITNDETELLPVVRGWRVVYRNGRYVAEPDLGDTTLETMGWYVDPVEADNEAKRLNSGVQR